ncbi:MAG: glycosyltransferase family 4 protein [Myxococcales bacterium]|jgi:glycosyltransferase involved in cell wall biosynthesis|nr:glycosyltransferase family 4 protein [Myxococcales bacterium]
MRIVIDMQGAQTQSRFRGIGRYTLGLSKAIARNRGRHEVLLALNGMMAGSIDAIRDEFAALLPQDDIRVWSAPGPTAWTAPDSEKNRKLAERIHARFIESLAPDAVLFTSLFEGFDDDFACDVQQLKNIKNLAGVVYDFIPLKNPKTYLPNQLSQKWYQSRHENLKSLETLFCISDFIRTEAQKYLPDNDSLSISTDTDSFFSIPENSEGIQGSLQSKWSLTRDYVLYVGGLEDRKNVPALIAAFAALPRTIRQQHQLAIVCGAQENMRSRLRHVAKDKGLSERDVRLIGYISNEELRDLYSACRLFAFPSLEEGFGLPVLEAMRCGAPVIASNRSSLPEVVGLDEALFDPEDIHSFADKLNQALSNPAFLQKLRRHSVRQQKRFSWDKSARLCLQALERVAESNSPTPSQRELNLSSLCADILAASDGNTSTTQKVRLAKCLANTFEDPRAPRQFFVDVSELCRHDEGTGIQRVTRSYLTFLLKNPPKGHVVRPVYATPDELGYRYAHTFMKQKFDFDDGMTRDDFIDYRHDDFFFGLDFQSSIVPQQAPALESLHRHGVRIYFFVHDLLPIYSPKYFRVGSEAVHLRWLQVISRFDGVICNSMSTADDYSRWRSENIPQRKRPFDTQWIHLGSDIQNSIPSQGMPKDAAATLQALRSRPTFLMVSTVEPRKGYAQALDAFDLLWKQGLDVNLAIVGKKGWNIQATINRLKRHPQKGKQLFWLKGISDEYLDAVYGAATAVIMASEAEGFGLAVVEGARHDKPLILRDLPVFREIAGDNALYFQGMAGEDLATAIQRWIALNTEGIAPTSKGIRCLTWNESARMLLDKLPI